MNNGGRICSHLKALLDLFAPHCTERETLDELVRILAIKHQWAKAHDLFSRIRRKTLVAEREGKPVLVAQFLFEEICAKTLYNLSNEDAPFDADSPYWIVPNAIALARELQIDDSLVVDIVASSNR